MRPEELVGIYNHVRRNGGYRPEAMTDIAGMMINVVRLKSDGAHTFGIARRYDVYENESWVIGFKMQTVVGPGGHTLWLRRPPKSGHWRDASINGDCIIGTPSILHYLGNYDACQRDSALLRMFSSEWEQPHADV